MQEVKAAAAEALKEMAAYEKQEVGLEEKRKHSNSKAKKLKKSLQDVSRLESCTKRRLTGWIALGRERSQRRTPCHPRQCGQDEERKEESRPVRRRPPEGRKGTGGHP